MSCSSWRASCISAMLDEDGALYRGKEMEGAVGTELLPSRLLLLFCRHKMWCQDARVVNLHVGWG